MPETAPHWIDFTPEEMKRMKHWANVSPDDITDSIKHALETPEAQASYQRMLGPMLEVMEKTMMEALKDMDKEWEPGPLAAAFVKELKPELDALKHRIKVLEAALIRGAQR